MQRKRSERSLLLKYPLSPRHTGCEKCVLNGYGFSSLTSLADAYRRLQLTLSSMNSVRGGANDWRLGLVHSS